MCHHCQLANIPVRPCGPEGQPLCDSCGLFYVSSLPCWGFSSNKISLPIFLLVQEKHGVARPLPTLGTDFIAQYIEPSFMPTSKSHLEKVIDKVRERGLARDVDFTRHQLENGGTISTQERVVKDVRIVPHYCAARVSDYEINRCKPRQRISPLRSNSSRMRTKASPMSTSSRITFIRRDVSLRNRRCTFWRRLRIC